MKLKKAFTLIELLVVIAIIGILATVSVIALSNARAKSRDAKRIGDIKQVQTALELYFNDMSRYPLTAEFANSVLSTSTQGTTTYMARIPVAATPADGNCSDSDNSFYYSSADGSTYTLSFCIGGDTGSLTAGLNTLSPGGIAYGGPGSGGGSGPSCSCTSASVPCCDNCDPADAVCQGGTYCGRNDNCPVGQGCDNGTCSNFVCGVSTVEVTSIGTYTCNEASPNYDTCTYDTVSVGSQCWLKQNMNIGVMVSSYGQSNNEIVEKYCQAWNNNNCITYGGLYIWAEGMQYAAGPIAQGICPSGWHVPTDADWGALEDSLDSGSCNKIRVNAWDCAPAGAAIKAGGSTGFNDLLGGYWNRDNAGWDLGGGGYFWTSLVAGSNDGIMRQTNSGSSIARYYGLGGLNRTWDAFSVRCIKD